MNRRSTHTVPKQCDRWKRENLKAMHPFSAATMMTMMTMIRARAFVRSLKIGQKSLNNARTLVMDWVNRCALRILAESRLSSCSGLLLIFGVVI